MLPPSSFSLEGSHLSAAGLVGVEPAGSIDEILLHR
jgi:hypothetical protein